jgi:hypothetical protein
MMKFGLHLVIVRRIMIISGLLWVLVHYGLAQDAPNLSLYTTLQSSYRPGGSDTVEITVTLNDPELQVDGGVLFLNIVEVDPDRSWPQAMHRLFSSGSESNTIFQRFLDGDTLREGLSTSYTFTFRQNAPLGNYALVVQLFRGRNTNPNRVRVEDRIALRAVSFRVERP